MFLYAQFVMIIKLLVLHYYTYKLYTNFEFLNEEQDVLSYFEYFIDIQEYLFSYFLPPPV